MKSKIILLTLFCALPMFGQSFVTVDNAPTNAVPVVMADDGSCYEAFNKGLYFGATVVAGCLAFSLLRTIPGGDKEDL